MSCKRRNLKEVIYLKLKKRRNKKGQATYITPLQPNTFAAFPPWRIQRELVVQDLPGAKIQSFFSLNNHFFYIFM